MSADIILAFWDELEKVAAPVHTPLMFDAMRRELLKIAGETPSYPDRALAAAPLAGATVGGLWGLASPQAFNPEALFTSLKGHGAGLRGRAVSGVLGAGLGATTAWLPSTVRDAYRAILPQRPQTPAVWNPAQYPVIMRRQ
jgi:hypothetical protein